jgi:hypothetical protein
MTTHDDHNHGPKVPIPLGPNEVQVRPVDQILAGCNDPKKPSAGAVAEALLSLQRQVLLVNNNQGILQRQHAKLAAAIDRATDTLFDKADGDGGVSHGVASAVHALYERMAGIENATSNYVLFSAATVEFLRSSLPQLIEANGGKFPSEKQCEAALTAIMEDMKRQGDEAQANRARLEKSIEKMYNCAFCTSWCKKVGIIVPGQEQRTECAQEFVQLACPNCMQICPQPTPPMELVEGLKCGACGTSLQREVTDENGVVRTMCQLMEPDAEKARQELRSQGIPEGEVLAAFPIGVSPIEKNIASGPSVGVAEIPPGPTRPLEP